MFGKKLKPDEELEKRIETGDFGKLSNGDLIRIVDLSRTKYCQSTDEIEVLEKRLNSANTRSNEIGKKAKELEKKYSKLELDKAYLENSKEHLQKSLEKKENELKRKNQEYESLETKVQEKGNEIIELNNQISELKAPFKIEDLKELIGEHTDKTYQQIKEALITEFLSKSSIVYGYFGKEKEPNKTRDLLISNGITDLHTSNEIPCVSVSVRFGGMGSKNLLYDDNEINNLKIDFSDSNDKGTELKKNFSLRKFKNINISNNRTGYNVEFCLLCPEENIYRKMIMQDAAIYVKAVLMGEIKNRIEKGDYSTAKNIIKNNKLEELALPYIKNNLEKKPEMVAYFAELVQEDK